MFLEFAMALATSVTGVTAPTITFTSDSVYTDNTVITATIIEEEDSTYSLQLEKASLLGYCIYDVTDTPYIDGVKLDSEFITDWKIPNYDPSVEHTLLVKTVYTDDVAGMLAAASKGDFTKMLSNPVMLFQLFYYILAAISLIVGGIGVYKSKKYKAKTSQQMAADIHNSSTTAFTKMESAVTDIFATAIIPVIQQIQNQNKDILEALIISRGTDVDSQIALIDLLKKATNSTAINELAESIKLRIQESVIKASQIKQEALAEVNTIIEETSSTEKPEIQNKDTYGGISV